MNGVSGAQSGVIDTQIFSCHEIFDNLSLQIKHQGQLLISYIFEYDPILESDYAVWCNRTLLSDAAVGTTLGNYI